MVTPAIRFFVCALTAFFFMSGVGYSQLNLQDICPAQTKRASVAIGKSESNNYAGSREIGGWLTFLDLQRYDELLWAVCFSQNNERAVYLLPKGLQECRTKDGRMTCSTESFAETHKVNPPKENEETKVSDREDALKLAMYEAANLDTMGLPSIVVQSIADWTEYCVNEEDALQQFTSETITYVDIDGDGDGDFILNGDEMTCVDPKTGNVRAGGGGNGATSLEVFTNKGKSFVRHYFYVERAEILKYRGYAVVWLVGVDGEEAFRIKDGKVTRVKAVPQGGEQVYFLGR